MNDESEKKIVEDFNNAEAAIVICLHDVSANTKTGELSYTMRVHSKHFNIVDTDFIKHVLKDAIETIKPEHDITIDDKTVIN